MLQISSKTPQSETARSSQNTSAGSEGATLSPPPYGIDFVDRQVERENNTGLPDRLKAGIENLSGMAMDDVRVHYHSSKPAELQALAYTQGTDIFMGPEQERHLPHEAWHVVQQKQGRVRPTMQAKGVAINDDAGLEREADVMGSKAWQMRRPDPVATGPAAQSTTAESREREARDGSEVSSATIGASGEKVRLNILSTFQGRFNLQNQFMEKEPLQDKFNPIQKATELEEKKPVQGNFIIQKRRMVEAVYARMQAAHGGGRAHGGRRNLPANVIEGQRERSMQDIKARLLLNLANQRLDQEDPAQLKPYGASGVRSSFVARASGMRAGSHLCEQA